MRAKSWIIWTVLVFGVMFFGGAPGAEAQGRGKPIGELLKPDGTLDLGSGYTGNIDPSGYALKDDGSPSFVAVDPDARWSSDYTAPGVNGSVSALTIDASGNLYAGGDFTTAGGVSASCIAKWNSTSWQPLGSGMNVSFRWACMKCEDQLVYARLSILRRIADESAIRCDVRSGSGP